MQMKYLKNQAMFALNIVCGITAMLYFPNAMIAGDVVRTNSDNKFN